MLRGFKNKGFASIVEVIITSIIFVIAAAGILSTFSMLRPQGGVASQKIEAAYIAKGILEDLRKQVDAVTWDSGDLTVGTHSLGVIDGYTVSYIVEQTTPNLRHVVINVTWPNS